MLVEVEVEVTVAEQSLPAGQRMEEERR